MDKYERFEIGWRDDLIEELEGWLKLLISALPQKERFQVGHGSDCGDSYSEIPGMTEKEGIDFFDGEYPQVFEHGGYAYYAIRDIGDETSSGYEYSRIPKN